MTIHHEQLLARMKALGYKINEQGMCYGFSTMSAQAFLAEDLTTYNNRLTLLENISPNQLDSRIEDSKKKVKKRKVLSIDDKLLLSTPAFFDGVTISFRPSDYPEYFHSGHLPLQDAEFSFPLTLPQALSDAKTQSIDVAKVTTFSGIYDHNEMK